jgi:hypothetical protein
MSMTNNLLFKLKSYYFIFIVLQMTSYYVNVASGGNNHRHKT